MHWKSWGLLALVFGVTLLGPGVLVAQASTLQGTPVTITGVDDGASTFWSYARGPVGKLIAAGLMFTGLGKLATTRGEGGGKTFLAGVASGFVPHMANSSVDSTPAATEALVASLGHVGSALQGFIGTRLPVDPVFYAALVLSLGLLALSRRQSALGIV
jgi:hypothetical protein